MSRPFGCIALTLFLVSCIYMRSDALDWPSDFWTQITNSMALPSGLQIAESTGKVLSDSVSGDTAFSDAVGSENEPFDSRWRTFGISNGSSVDSRPCGMVLTVR